MQSRNAKLTYEPGHEISNNVVCATSKASDQPAHMRSLIRAFASRLNTILESAVDGAPSQIPTLKFLTPPAPRSPTKIFEIDMVTEIS